MKRLFFPLLLLLMTSPAFAQIHAQIFVHPAHGFEIQLPPDWERRTEGMEPVVLYAMSNLDNQEDPFRENVSVALNSTKGKTREEFLALSKESLKVSFPEMKMEHEESRVVNGVEMTMWVYTYQANALQLKAKTFLMLLSDTGYAITCTGTTETFAEYEALFSKITASFQFKAKGQR